MVEPLSEELRFAIEAAGVAGKRLEALRRSGRWEGELLGDVGDQAADGYLQGILAGRFPEDGVLSEETASDGRRLEKSRVWIVDPLDGTKEYGERRYDWAVHVGLAIDGAPVLGAVALPATGEVLFGVGSERAGLEGGSRDLVRGDAEAPARPVVAVSRSHTPDWVLDFTRKLGGEMRPFGSVGFKVSRLFFGEADIYVHQKGLKEWDTCAPEAVARALGWSVTTFSGAEHRYNRENPRNEEIVVCRPSWRERVLQALGVSG
ncbi:MAG: 3'(2'),5'-bisphosphate nucleotidase CysQ [Vicinamibacteria bacterium]